jgi:hypothetical protein
MTISTDATATNPRYQQVVDTPRRNYNGGYLVFFRNAWRITLNALTILAFLCALAAMSWWFKLIANGQITQVRPHCGCLAQYGYNLCLEQGQCCLNGSCNATAPAPSPECLPMQVKDVYTDLFGTMMIFFFICALTGFISSFWSQYKVLGLLCMLFFGIFILVINVKWPVK